jgi:hypothetical protein
MKMLLFFAVYIPLMGSVLGWLIWKKHFRDVFLVGGLILISGWFWYRVLSNRPFVITSFLMKLFDGLKGWWS